VEVQLLSFSLEMRRLHFYPRGACRNVGSGVTRRRDSELEQFALDELSRGWSGTADRHLRVMQYIPMIFFMGTLVSLEGFSSGWLSSVVGVFKCQGGKAESILKPPMESCQPSDTVEADYVWTSGAPLVQFNLVYF